MSPTRRQVLASVAVGSIGLAGCSGGGDGGDGGGSNGNSGNTTEVELVATAFDPVVVEIDVGAAVEWVNNDPYEHDVTAAQLTDAGEDWSYSETLAASSRTEQTFDSAGVYEYYCSIHGESSMCGAVVVGDASLEQSLPCQNGE